MHAVIFAGGTLRMSRPAEEALAHADLLLAADGGAATALSLGLQPAAVLGDLDSLAPTLVTQLEQGGTRLIRAPVEKDETDSELALQYALAQGAQEVTLLGAFGGARCDHTFANLLLLVAYETATVRIIDGAATCWLLRGPGVSRITGQRGDLLSLLPLAGDARGVRSANLYYPLHGETLHFGRPRGLSNQLTAEEATVSLEQGLLLLIHTRQEELLPPEQG
jgi:thiamine pyrophosphokinase